MVALCWLAASVALSVKAQLGERHYAQTQLWSRTDPLQAFLAIKAAHDAMPLDARFRMQYVMTLEHLRSSGAKVRLDKEAADRIFDIASSASPAHPAVMVARASYMLNSERWNEPQVKELVERLKAKASLYPESWMVVAFYNGKKGDHAQAASALVKGLTAGGKLKDFQRVARQINLEIEQ